MKCKAFGYSTLENGKMKCKHPAVTIEIPKGSRNKYEVDHESGKVYLDRYLFTPMAYPADYGFIDHTLGEDGDPLDALRKAPQRGVASFGLDGTDLVQQIRGQSTLVVALAANRDSIEFGFHILEPLLDCVFLLLEQGCNTILVLLHRTMDVCGEEIVEGVVGIRPDLGSEVDFDRLGEALRSYLGELLKGGRRLVENGLVFLFRLHRWEVSKGEGRCCGRCLGQGLAHHAAEAIDVLAIRLRFCQAVATREVPPCRLQPAKLFSNVLDRLDVGRRERHAVMDERPEDLDANGKRSVRGATSS